jgi:hypothetical protein
MRDDRNELKKNDLVTQNSRANPVFSLADRPSKREKVTRRSLSEVDSEQDGLATNDPPW